MSLRRCLSLIRQGSRESLPLVGRRGCQSALGPCDWWALLASRPGGEPLPLVPGDWWFRGGRRGAIGCAVPARGPRRRRACSPCFPALPCAGPGQAARRAGWRWRCARCRSSWRKPKKASSTWTRISASSRAGTPMMWGEAGSARLSRQGRAGRRGARFGPAGRAARSRPRAPASLCAPCPLRWRGHGAAPPLAAGRGRRAQDGTTAGPLGRAGKRTPRAGQAPLTAPTFSFRPPQNRLLALTGPGGGRGRGSLLLR